jgi:hypothetical protein
MCRSIRVLRQPDRQPTDQELHEAALQFVRKLSGYRQPARANQEAFDTAVRDVAAVARTLFQNLEVRKASAPAAASSRLSIADVGRSRRG